MNNILEVCKHFIGYPTFEHITQKPEALLDYSYLTRWNVEIRTNYKAPQSFAYGVTKGNFASNIKHMCCLYGRFHRVKRSGMLRRPELTSYIEPKTIKNL